MIFVVSQFLKSIPTGLYILVWSDDNDYDIDNQSLYLTREKFPPEVLSILN
jgi:hypothetical protein